MLRGRHPHNHGSTALQVLGGAAGALIIEQESDAMYEAMENMPSWLYEMSELIIMVQYFDLPSYTTMMENGYDEDIDYLSWYDSSDESCVGDDADGTFYTLNGEYEPTICLTSDEWTRLRIVNTHYNEAITMYFDTTISNTNGVSSDMNTNYCELWLIARDGILLDNGPRDVRHIWLAEGQRADVAVSCHIVSSEFSFKLYDATGNYSYGFIEVSEASYEVESVELSSFEPIRPSYLEDLMDYTGSFQSYTQDSETNDYFTIMTGRYDINNEAFAGEGSFLTSLEYGSVNEWNIGSAPNTIAQIHPFHLHMYSFQVISGGFNDSSEDIPKNWHEPGDYVKYST